MIVGVSGSFGSGKDILGVYLADKYGFMNISTGDIVREIAQEQRGSIERPVLHEVANELRHKYGGGVLVERAIDRYHNSIRTYAGATITGIRSLGEAKAIKALGGQLVFVDAPFDIRYNRMVERQRDAETQITLEEFRAREESEISSGVTDADFNLGKIEQIADFKLINDSSLEDFYKAADKALFS